MDANVTASQSEHDHDNSSLQNPSTNPAEAGTTDETRDEDHETSSIEALNWSEVEEEELAAAQQQATLAASATRGKLPSTEEETKVNIKTDKDDDSVTNNGSSGNDEGSMLSTTLLQSINSSSDEDPQARKQSVIENWASEVTNAVERGEIEMAEDFPDDNGTTGDDEEEEGNADSNCVRKRKGKKLSPELVSSMMSTASNGESNADPLSNAPVLDDGPIWNKGPRSYTFQENRRINQKLTFMVLIAVVLAIGLGLGNLVAHQECEAEYKASQQSQTKSHTDKISVHTVPTTTTPAPIIPDKSTDSSMMGSSLPKKQQPASYVDSSAVPNEKVDDDGLVTSGQQNADKRQNIPVNSFNEPRPRRRDEPVIDPKYKTHAETVSSVVHTLDRLSREIDQNENTTRKLQGVLMIPDEEKSTEEPIIDSSASLFDEEVHREDDDEGNVKNYYDDEVSLLDDGERNDDEADLEDEENEQAIIEDLIEAIEQTPDYLERKMHEKQWEEFEKNRPRSKLFSADPAQIDNDPTRDHDIEMLLKSVKQFKDFERRFVKSERKRLREEGKYDRLSWRLPKEYTEEEKNALQVRYRSNWQEFLKLIKAKVPDPIESLFGTEEEDKEERTLGDLLYFPFPDPDRDLTEEERDALVKKNFEVAHEGMKIKPSERQDTSETTFEQLDATAGVGETKNLQDLDDDLIITESKEEHLESIEPASTSTSSHHQEEVTEKDQAEVDDNSIIIGKSIEESSKVHVDDETRLKLQNSANAEANRLALEKMKRDALVAKPSKLKPKKSASKATAHDATGTNDKRSQGQSQNKNGKRDQKQKEQKVKQGKQKGKNGGSSNNSGNANDSASGGRGKMSSKGKKVKNLESNKVFENIKGKSVDKRRGASPETQRQGKFGTDTKYSDLKKKRIEGNPEPNKKSTSGSTNKKEQQGGGHGDTASAASERQKLRQAQHQHENSDNQKTNKLNSNARSNNNNQPNGGGPKNQEPNKEQKRQKQQNEKKNKSDFPSDKRSVKPSQENKDSFSKETQFQQQKEEFNAKPEVNRNNNNNLNSGAHQNGKRSKNWQSKEKAERREKSRERFSSWGT